MGRTIIFLFTILFWILSFHGSFGQETTSPDSLGTPRDTLELYKRMKSYSERNKIASQIHKWIFRRDSKRSIPPKIDYGAYDSLQNRARIRHVLIVTEDPFGHSVFDTLKEPKSILEKAGNAIHAKTKRMAINKFILFKAGHRVDTVLIQETARLLREQKYVHDVNIIPEAVPSEPKAVDILIKVLDSWSLLPRGSFSSSHFKVGLRERNFIGFGHEARLSYSKRFTDGERGIGAKYMIPNIANTFIDMTGSYESTFDHFQDKYVSVRREFFSPLTRWAGGLFVQERSLERPFILPDYEVRDHELKFYYQDYWLGHSFPLGNKSKEKEGVQQNLILALRTALVNYRDLLPREMDEARYFSNEQLYLGSLSLASRRYERDHHIFRDGITEDVPTGELYSLISGAQRKNHRTRIYLGGQVMRGGYLDWGFLSGSVGMGAFFGKRHTEQVTLNIKANYFSNLWKLGDRGWRMRQFVKPQIVIGVNREKSFNDRLGLNERPYFRGVNSYEYIDYEDQHQFIDYQTGDMQGFDSAVIGTRKYVLDLQTQFYSPWEVMGFRLNPFASATLSVLTGGEKSYGSNRLYSSFSIGFIIRNDYFVFDAFQLSLSYYPSMPGEGYDVFKANSIRNDNFGFQDFKVDEPRPIIYQ